MIVRIQLGQGQAPRNAPGKNRHVALACAALLIPAALMAYVLGFWRLASDIGVAREFAIGGLFSHWQVWICTAALLHLGATVLNRYGHGGRFHLPRFLMIHFGGDPAPPLPHADELRRANASKAS
jgi:hypothetical protein